MPAQRSFSFASAVVAVVTGLAVASPMAAANGAPYEAAAREVLRIAIDAGRASGHASAIAAGDPDAFAMLVEVDARVQERFGTLGVLTLGEPALLVPTQGPAASVARAIGSLPAGDDAVELQAALAPFSESFDAIMSHSTGLLELQERARQVRKLSRAFAESAERLSDQLAAPSAAGYAGG